MKLLRYQYPTAHSLRALNQRVGCGAPGLSRLSGALDDLLGSASTSVETVPVDLFEAEEGYFARFELPGMKKDSIGLRLEEGVLTIEPIDATAEGGPRFERSISIPDGVDHGKVGANYESGILTVSMPKEEARKPRQITVE
ncbi:Hsp20/alpha crystallin family protein [Coraliomargarita akajimensis]|uniref:Heat shock protein Hsp20 n=1 Tax=Coraliomargarita akajimensis (strain DSM 45221 / IAM 15411 / JCM 23193 / KCTC 12865 / 04OKA010-24) TaxID=583355 RepID=D5ENM5_CORAD|nr:Hsp20/alpha crystallin family protein [Coraliomargarita akajimensis]ADE55501.1 heat shock protein Hsp20 [Coraliomargarita akajimensis DSM 45221]